MSYRLRFRLIVIQNRSGQPMSDATATPVATPKKIVRDALDRMPENATLPEIADEIAMIAALQESMEDFRQGRVSPQSEVAERMKRLCSE